MKKNKIINILIILVVIMIIILGYKIFSKYYMNYQNEKSISEFIKAQEKEDKEFENTVNNAEETIEKKPKFKGYDVLGIINIEKIGLSYPIIQTNDDKDKAMKISIVKFYGDKLNKNGNVTLAGHNYYDSTMFAKLHLLNIGDKIKTKDNFNKEITYEVVKKYNVSPNDTACLETNDMSIKELTLITCTKGNAERLVVKAVEIN